MDILKELFGGCDELQINKTLFGADVGHDIALDHALSSRENLPHPLPILPEPRPHTTPPHLLRSHSLDGLHSAPSSSVSEERDIMGLGRSFRPQSAFPQLTKSSNHDWHHVPSEMPMYLLQEDEGNEEEIMRLLGSSGQPLSPSLWGSQAGTDHGVKGPPMSSQTRILATTSCDHSVAPPTSCNHPSAPPTSYSSPAAPPTAVIGRAVNGLSTGENRALISEGSVKVGGTPDYAAQGGEHLVTLQSSGSLVAAGVVCSPSLAGGVSQDTVVTDEPLSKGPGQHEDILAKAASLIPVEFHQLVNEVTNQISDPVESQSSNLFRAVLLEMSKLDRNVEATTTDSFSQEEITASMNDSVLTLDGTSLCPESASVRCQVSDRPLPGSIGFGGVATTHLGVEYSSADGSTTSTSNVRVNPIFASHQIGARHWPSQRMVNEGTQTSHHLSPKSGQLVHNDRPTTMSPASTVHVSLTDSGGGLHRSQMNTPQVSQRRILRSQSAPVVQSTTDSFPPSKHPSVPIQLSSGFSSNSSSSPSQRFPPSLTRTEPVVATSLAEPAVLTSLAEPAIVTSLAEPTVLTTLTEPAVLTSPPTVLGPPDSGLLSLERRVSVTSSALQALDALTSVLQNSIAATQQSHRTSAPNGHTSASLLGNTAGETILSPHQQSVATQPSMSLKPATSAGQAMTAVSTPATALPLSAGNRSTEPSQCMVTGQLAKRSQESVFPSSHRSELVGNSAIFSPGDGSAHRRLSTSVQATTVTKLPVLSAASTGETALEVSPIAVGLEDGPHVAVGNARGIIAGSGSFHSEATPTASAPQHTPCATPPVDVSTLSSVESSPMDPRSVGKEHRRSSVTSDPARTTPPSVTSTAEPSVHTPSSVQGGGATAITTNSTPELTGEDIGLVISSVCSLAQNGSPESNSRDSGHEVQDTSSKADNQRRESKSYNSSEMTSSAPGPMDTDRTAQQQAVSERDRGLPFLRLQGTPSISLCFPMVGWNGQTVPGPVIGVAATPVELVRPSADGRISRSTDGSQRDKSGADSTAPKVKRRHGGGWPKGKRRKVLTEPQPPKPPATGYALFLAERRPGLQRELGSNSMSLLSKALGKKWASLPKEEREEFYARAETDRRRYLEELRHYLTQVHGENSGDNLEKLDTFLNHSFASESDDDVLMCQLCQITFHCLHNKRTHYSGKLHTDALLEQLNRLLGNGPKSKSKPKGRQEMGKTSSHAQDSHAGITNGRPDRSPDTGSQPVGSVGSATEERGEDEGTQLDAGDKAPSVGACVEQDVAPSELALGQLSSSDAPDGGEGCLQPMHTTGDMAVGASVEVGVAPVEVGVAWWASNPATTAARDPTMEEAGACHRKSRPPSLLRDLASSYEAVTADLSAEEEKRGELMAVLAGLHQQCEQLEFMDEGLSRELADLQEKEEILQRQTLQLTQIFNSISSNVSENV